MSFPFCCTTRNGGGAGSGYTGTIRHLGVVVVVTLGVDDIDRVGNKEGGRRMHVECISTKHSKHIYHHTHKMTAWK